MALYNQQLVDFVLIKKKMKKKNFICMKASFDYTIKYFVYDARNPSKFEVISKFILSNVFQILNDNNKTRHQIK